MEQKEGYGVVARSVIMALAIAASPVVTSAQVFQCGEEPCVFVYRGPLPIPSVPDTWVKEVEIADLDGDLVPDLYAVIKQPLERNLLVQDSWIKRRNNADVVFAGSAGFDFDDDALNQGFRLRPTSEVFPTPFSTVRGYDAEVVDFDRDGHLDIIRPDTTGILKMLWNDGDGVFTEVDDVFVDPQRDPNVDCELDVLNPFNPPDGPLTGGNYDDTAVADLDGDGDMDFIVGQYDDCGENLLIESRWAESAGGRQLRHAGGFQAFFTHSVSAGLVNGDYHVDVLLGHTKSSRDPELFLSNGPLSYAAAVTFPGLNAGLPTTIADLVGADGQSRRLPGLGQPDLDGDGRPEVVLGQNGSGRFHIYFHTGDDAKPYAGATTCTGDCQAQNDYDARYGDFNLDGLIDVVTVSINVGNDVGDPLGQPFTVPSDIRFFSVAADRSFVDSTAAFLAPPPAGENQHVGGIAVAVGDLDLDGDLDLVMGGALGDDNPTAALHVYENRTLVGTQTVDLAVEISHVAEEITLRLENRGSAVARDIELELLWGSFDFDEIPLTGELEGKCVFHPNRIMGDIEWYTCTYTSLAAGGSIVVGRWQAIPAPVPSAGDPLGSFVSGRVIGSGSPDLVVANDQDSMQVQPVNQRR